MSESQTPAHSLKRNLAIGLSVFAALATIAGIAIPLIVSANDKTSSADSLDVREPGVSNSADPSAPAATAFEVIGELEDQSVPREPSFWAVPVTAPVASFPDNLIIENEFGGRCSDDQSTWLREFAIPLSEYKDLQRSPSFLLTLHNHATTGGSLSLGNIRFEGEEVDSVPLVVFWCPFGSSGDVPPLQTIDIDATGAAAVWSEVGENGFLDAMYGSDSIQPPGTPVVLSLAPGQVRPVIFLRSPTVDTQREYQGRFLADLLDGSGQTVVLAEDVAFHRELLDGFGFGYGIWFSSSGGSSGVGLHCMSAEGVTPCTFQEAIAMFRELAATNR